MAELSAISSSIITIVRLVEFATAYNEVSSDARQLLESVKLADRKVNHAKRLRRTKSQFLETHFKHDVDEDIAAAEEIVNSIGLTIERCRVDLETNGNKVKPLTKLKWLFKDNDAFRSKGWSLTNTLNTLVGDIQVMENVQPLLTVIEPPTYIESERSRGPLRSPSALRKLAKQKSESSLVKLDEVIEKHNQARDMRLVQTHDGLLSTGKQARPEWPFYSDSDYRVDDHGGGADVTARQPVPIPEAVEMPTPPGGWWMDEPWRDKLPEEKIVVDVQPQIVTGSRPRRLRSACIR